MLCYTTDVKVFSLSGCLVDLAITVSIYVCVTQYSAVFSEFGLPRLFNCYYQIMNGERPKDKKKHTGGMKEERDVKKRHEMRQWERDFFLIDKVLFLSGRETSFFGTRYGGVEGIHWEMVDSIFRRTVKRRNYLIRNKV